MRYGSSLNDLASLYGKMGDYPRAELLLRQALDIDRQARPNRPPDSVV